MTASVTSSSILSLTSAADKAAATAPSAPNTRADAADDSFHRLLKQAADDVEAKPRAAKPHADKPDAETSNAEPAATDSGKPLPSAAADLPPPAAAAADADPSKKADAGADAAIADVAPQDLTLTGGVVLLQTTPPLTPLQPQTAPAAASVDTADPNAPAVAAAAVTDAGDAEAPAAQTSLLGSAKARATKNKTDEKGGSDAGVMLLAVTPQVGVPAAAANAVQAQAQAQAQTQAQSGAQAQVPAASPSAEGLAQLAALQAGADKAASPVVLTGKGGLSRADALNAAGGDAVDAQLTAPTGNAGNAAALDGDGGAAKPKADADFATLIKQLDANTPTASPSASNGIDVSRSAPAAGSRPYADVSPNTATVSVPVGANGWSDAVTDKVMWFSASKINSAEIHLNPPDLGPLQVRISTERDQTSVYFTSQHAAVREALDQALPRLRDMMGGQGIQLSDVGVGGQGAPQQQSHRGDADGNGNPRSARSSFFGDSADISEPVAVSSISAARIGRSGIDAYA